MRRNMGSLLNMGVEAGALAAPDVSGSDSGPDANEGEPGLTEVRIAGVANAIKNTQLQRAIRGVAGAQVEGQPRFEGGLLTLSLRHDPSLDLKEALEGLAGAGLRFQDEPAPGVLEFAAA